ncbi:hypothetical protein VTJ49DRAFT_3769 [Mycothermus thermophilus]|uniref:Uncharacterized protein n=1 Tax=Humicola insolens TaxID=85995 RepID=A0ABR3V6Q8_HUMIN
MASIPPATHMLRQVGNFVSSGAAPNPQSGVAGRGSSGNNNTDQQFYVNVIRRNNGRSQVHLYYGRTPSSSSTQSAQSGQSGQLISGNTPIQPQAAGYQGNGALAAAAATAATARLAAGRNPSHGSAAAFSQVVNSAVQQVAASALPQMARRAAQG